MGVMQKFAAVRPLQSQRQHQFCSSIEPFSSPVKGESVVSRCCYTAAAAAVVVVVYYYYSSGSRKLSPREPRQTTTLQPHSLCVCFSRRQSSSSSSCHRPQLSSYSCSGNNVIKLQTGRNHASCCCFICRCDEAAAAAATAAAARNAKSEWGEKERKVGYGNEGAPTGAQNANMITMTRPLRRFKVKSTVCYDSRSCLRSRALESANTFFRKVQRITSTVWLLSQHPRLPPSSFCTLAVLFTHTSSKKTIEISADSFHVREWLS